MKRSSSLMITRRKLLPSALIKKLHGQSCFPFRSETESFELLRHGLAWLGLCAAFALHVTDEALTGFLSVYNPTVLAIRETFPNFPMPIFTFRVWLVGLIGLIVI